MQLKRFNAFVSQLRQKGTFQGLAELNEVYLRSGEDWYDSNHSLIIDEVHQFTLNKVLARDHHWRPAHGLRAFFPVSGLEVVVVVNTETPSRAPTRDKIQQIVGGALKHSADEFDAQHDGLTGLANSRLIEESIQQVSVSSIPPGAADQLTLLHGVALLALDIDHFKQVNDSYGHAYGDLVLHCFAQRLEQVAAEIRSQFAGIDVLPGRMSGEEFVVLLSGGLSATTVSQIAERVRLVVADAALPSDVEWETIPSQRRQSTLVLPHISERRVTASVGVSSVLTPALRSTPVILDLRREADAALYRAKTGGRNTVRLFPEIRDKYGTVIEHHNDTGIVVIDIGSQVNVQ